MKTLTTLLFAVTAAVSFNANASALHGDPAINEVFPMQATSLQPQQVSSVANTGELVWSVAYEEYVNPADFNLTSSATGNQSLASALQALDSNPPAAGSMTSKTPFVWDATAGEYQLQ